MTRDLPKAKDQLVSRDYIDFPSGGALIFMSPGFLNPSVYNALYPRRSRCDVFCRSTIRPLPVRSTTSPLELTRAVVSRCRPPSSGHFF
jgi:hypothetical protein